MLQLNFNPFPNLESERLSFRKLNKEDAPEVLKLRGNTEIMKYIPRPLAKNNDDALAHIATINTNIDNKKY